MSGEGLARKVAAIRSRTARVRELFPSTVEDFLVRRTESEALILNLYLALQGAAILRCISWPSSGSAYPEKRAAFEALSRAGVLGAELSRKLSAAVGLRNRIAHEYGGLDLTKVYEAVRRDLGDLDEFAAAVAAVRLPMTDLPPAG